MHSLQCIRILKYFRLYAYRKHLTLSTTSRIRISAIITPKWYRPDLQGIVIVGDINVDEIEAKLKKVFAEVKAPVNPAERIYYPVADNQEPLIYIGTDKEVKNPSVNIFFKQDATPDSLKNTIAYYATNYMVSMAMNMLNNRLNELRQTANPPFTSAGAEYGEYFLAKTKEAFSISASSKIDGIDLATKTILEESRTRTPLRIYANRI